MAHKFWKWFSKNHEKYLLINDMENIEDKEALQSEMQSKLNEYCKDLYFEIGHQREGKTDLIITAEGDTKLFKDVKRLIRKAPKFENWEFVALKQPMGTDFKVNYEGIEIDPNQVWFLPLKNIDKPDVIGLRVGFPNFIAAKEKLFIAGIFIVLDTILGEESNAENIGYVEVDFLPEQPVEKGYVELVKLPEFIEWKKGEATNFRLSN